MYRMYHTLSCYSEFNAECHRQATVTQVTGQLPDSCIMLGNQSSNLEPPYSIHQQRTIKDDILIFVFFKYSRFNGGCLP